MEPLAGRYDYLVAPPSVVRAGGSDWLVWWRRRNKESFSTDGIVEFSNPRSPDAVRRAFEVVDIGAAQLFAVPGDSPDGKVHLIGVFDHRGSYENCGKVKDGTNLVHFYFDPSSSAGKRGGCEVKSIDLPKDILPRKAFSHSPPQAWYEDNAIVIRLFRRTNEGLNAYSNRIRFLDMRIPLSGTDYISNIVVAGSSCFTIGENAEPMITFGKRRRLAASFVSENGHLALNIVKSANCDSTGQQRQVNLDSDAVSALRSRILWLAQPSSEAAQAEEKGVLIGVAPVSDPTKGREGVLADILTVQVSGMMVTGCNRVELSLRSSRDRSRLVDSLRRSAVPILADMDLDDVPDLVLAFRENGAQSVVVIGKVDRGNYVPQSNEFISVIRKNNCHAIWKSLY